ncbi:hypothetical protein FOZG_16870 [Fusarium oxysporum Fo47]|uniref:Fungal STAND N-terminal Goodbye domain-containing protein n=1 Tax=Fusarium oxysporum Fo47 TaxID=660027 RepID=W9JJA5_FUSOX|nr:hypothetical protein FOZG_16870 [Fusarium oxysporum Fo47]
MESSCSYVPTINLQPPAVDFIDNHLDSPHTACTTPPSRYSARQGAYIICEPLHSSQKLTAPVSPTGLAAQSCLSTPRNVQIPSRQLVDQPMVALKFWDSLFHRAMSQLKENHPTEPDLKQGFGIRDKTDCTAVFDQLEKAKETYSKKDKSFTAKFTRVYRKFVDNAAEPLLGASKFVPNIDYVTPILGAVQILLEAAIKAAKVREEVLSAFDDIDKVFSQVEGFLEIYKNDMNLEKVSIDLIATVFYAIECVIGFFIKSPGKRVIPATFNPESYKYAITESLCAIKAKAEHLISQADMSAKYETRNGLQMVLDRMPTPEEIEDIRRGQHFVNTSVLRLLNEYNNNLRAIYMDRMAFGYSRPCSPVPPMEQVNVEQRISPQELLDWINIPDLLVGDKEIIDRMRHIRVPSVERARAEQLVNTGQLREWLVSPHSAQLLIHGNYDIRCRVSGLTLLCTSLAGSLADRAPNCLCLLFYCGLHDNFDYDEYTGGRAVIQSFICQLLCQYDFSNCISVGDVRPDLLHLDDVDELCCLFERLVFQLPRSTLLVCLIDGVVYYEREEFMESMADVLVTLLRISKEQRTSANIKVLLTSPTKTMEVRRPFHDELILCMESRARSGVAASKGRLERQLNEHVNGVTELDDRRMLNIDGHG